MKKTLCLAIALTLCKFAMSQTLQTAYDNSRFIQTAPNLPVVIKAGNGAHALQIWGRSDGYGYLEFYNESGNGPARSIYGYGESLNYSAPSHNFIGNVGIGTANASSLLELRHSAPIITLTPASYNGLYQTTLGTRGSAQGFLILGNNGQNEIRAGNSVAGGYLDFFTSNMVGQETESNGNHVMRMAANGNVGIRTTNPSQSLDVNGNINISQGNFLNQNNSSGLSTRTFGIHPSNYMYIGGIDAQILGIVFRTSGSQERLFIDGATGNIGIGTTSPREKLSVNGNIRAREIKVEASPWPDYVFSKSYSPPTLQEIETHIKEKGHLPGIPSAEEVKNNGIELGEMNAKLLQKIEELTLLLIKEHQMNTARDKKITRLGSELNMLKKTFKKH